MPKGEDSAKTTKRQREEMYYFRCNGYTVKDIAAHYGLSPSTVSQHTVDRLRRGDVPRLNRAAVHIGGHGWHTIFGYEPAREVREVQFALE